MALEEGNEDGQQGQNNKTSQEELMKLVAEMSRKIQRLEKEKQPESVAGLGGMSPDQFAELVGKVTGAVKNRPEADSLVMSKFVESRDIDPEDFDEKGVRFSAFGTGYVIVDDVRNGFPVQTPFKNVIVFSYTGSRRGELNHKGERELATFSSYVSRSKKEQKWLREHKQFGVKFFESSAQALSVNAARAQMLSRFIDSLAAQDQNLVLVQCKSRGIEITGDMRNMRIALAEKMVEEQFRVQEEASRRTLNENFEESIFLQDKTKTTSEREGRK